MKLKVKVQDQYYEVDILDLNTRPVIAIVDGVEFEVWPQESASLPTAQLSEQKPVAAKSGAAAATAAASPSPVTSTPLAAAATMLRAPIPGVVVAIKVHPGDQVRNGQELLVLEAMKMRNTIRSPRDGQIATVHISNGQTVNHNDPLVEFAELGQGNE
ncbi:MAG: biotin/lipoyl-containing protein [Anaerolineales bacterium]